MIDYLDQETRLIFSARIERTIQNAIMNKSLKPHSVESFRALAWEQINNALYNNSCKSVLKELDNLVSQSAIAKSGVIT